MTRFEPRTSVVGSDCSTNCAKPLPFLALVSCNNFATVSKETERSEKEAGELFR